MGIRTMLRALVALWLLIPPCLAQQVPPDSGTAPVNPSAGASALTGGGGLSDFFTTRTPYEFWLTVVVTLSGLIVIGTVVWTVLRTAQPRPEDVTRPVIVLTIIMSSLVLVIAGFSNEQIAPAFGLFGTIIGYMLGRMNSPRADVMPSDRGISGTEATAEDVNQKVASSDQFDHRLASSKESSK
jgi:hypothetical protein